MKTIKTITRAVILYALITIAVVGILSEPVEANWLQNLIVSKSVGFAAATITLLLVRRWKNDPAIKKLNQFCSHE